MLAFDRDRLRHLGAALASCTETLTRCAITDPEAHDASRALTAATALLQPWITPLAQLAMCDVMDRHPAIAHRDGTRLGVEARLLAEYVGWEVVRDGALTDGQPLLGDAQLTDLVRRLDDPDYGSLLRDVLAVGDLTTVALVAGALPPPDIGRCGPIDAVLATVPLTSIGVLAVALGNGPGATPAAARAALAAVERMEGGLALLLLGDADPMAVMDLVTSAVSDLPAADAGTLVLAVTRLVVQGGTSDDETYRRRLGRFVAPYLLQFTSRAADWGIEQRDGARLLADVLHDSGAMEELVRARDTWMQSVPSGAFPASSSGGVAPSDAVAHLDDLAGMLGWLDAILHAEEIDDALAQRALWDASWFVIGAGVNLAIRFTGVTGPAHTAADRIADEVLDRLRSEMERDGSFGAPPTPGAIRADVAARHEWRRTALAATAAQAMVEVLRRRGASLSDPPSAPVSAASARCSGLEWLDRFDTWAATLDRRSRRAVHHAVRTVLNRYQAAEACHTLG